MKPIIVAGPPSAGKTAVIAHVAARLAEAGLALAAVKFDTRVSLDPALYRERLGIPAIGGLSGYLCPDHYFISNMEEALEWGKKVKADVLFVETAGLCLRCAPHVEGVLAVTLVDCLGGMQAPEKMGPMLALADVAVLTKGDLVSQAEREVLAYGISTINASAAVFPINGLTGTGALRLAGAILKYPETGELSGKMLRHDMPASICSYCTGERRIGKKFQSGSVEKLLIAETAC